MARYELQWGPVVVTGIRALTANDTSLYATALQWGPVVVTGISRGHLGVLRRTGRDASMGSGRGDRNQPGGSCAPPAAAC